MIWYETKPLILATGYIVKKIPPEDGKELFIFSLFLLLFQNVLRVGADDLLFFSLFNCTTEMDCATKTAPKVKALKAFALRRWFHVVAGVRYSGAT